MIRFTRVTKTYPRTGTAVHDVSLTVNKGEFLFLTGASGAGKTSLLRLLYLAQRPSRGIIRLFGEDAVTMPRGRLPGFRRRIGVVFQDFRLVPHLSTFDNVALPLRVSSWSSAAPGGGWSRSSTRRRSRGRPPQPTTSSPSRAHGSPRHARSAVRGPTSDVARSHNWPPVWRRAW